MRRKQCLGVTESFHRCTSNTDLRKRSLYVRPHELSDETWLALHQVIEHPIQSAYAPAEVYALTELLKSSPWLGEKQMSFNVHENEPVSHFTAECNRIHSPTNKVLKYLI